MATGNSYLLALDQGTTSSRALLIDQQGQVVGMAQQEFRQIYPEPGWVEHDAQEIWESQARVVKDLLRKLNGVLFRRQKLIQYMVWIWQDGGKEVLLPNFTNF